MGKDFQWKKAKLYHMNLMGTKSKIQLNINIKFAVNKHIGFIKVKLNFSCMTSFFFSSFLFNQCTKQTPRNQQVTVLALKTTSKKTIFSKSVVDYKESEKDKHKDKHTTQYK